MATPITWNNANFSWSNNSFTWEEVILVKEALGGGGVMAEDMPWTQFKDKRKNVLLKLIFVKFKVKLLKKKKKFKI